MIYIYNVDMIVEGRVISLMTGNVFFYPDVSHYPVGSMLFARKM